MAMVLHDSSLTRTTNNNNNKTTVDVMMSHKSHKKWGNHPYLVKQSRNEDCGQQFGPKFKTTTHKVGPANQHRPFQVMEILSLIQPRSARQTSILARGFSVVDPCGIPYDRPSESRSDIESRASSTTAYLYLHQSSPPPTAGGGGHPVGHVYRHA
jgi:hypothetical protein